MNKRMNEEIHEETEGKIKTLQDIMKDLKRRLKHENGLLQQWIKIYILNLRRKKEL